MTLQTVRLIADLPNNNRGDGPEPVRAEPQARPLARLAALFYGLLALSAAPKVAR